MTKPVAALAFMSDERHNGLGTAPEMIPIPGYMVYAALPDGRVIGLLGAIEKGNAMARFSSDEGSTWDNTIPQFPLDETIGGWSLHNCFLDRDGELQLIYTNDANTTRNSKSLYDIRYDIWHVRSRQARQSWNRPTLVWKGYAGSLLSFVQLRNGRVLLPFCYLTRRSWANRGQGFDNFTYMGRFSSSATYSDDNGQTWQLSPNELKEPTSTLYDDGGIEPIVLQLKDGRIWMLIRTQNGRFYESFSQDGSTWTHPVPSAILSSDSPCSLTRLRDGRVLMLWNNTLRFPYANGGRAVLHGAISEDDGHTWRGYREVAANPLAVEPPPPNGDHGVTYTVPALTASGKILTSLSTGPGGGTYLLRVDPQWLYETVQTDDFSHGLRGWSSFGTHGVSLETHPDKPSRQVLALRKPDENWPSGATWNFPAGKRGQLRLRIQVEPASSGALVGITDHFSAPFDEQDSIWNVFNFEIGPGGTVHEGSRLQPGMWHELTFEWNCDQRQCNVIQDGRPIALLHMKRDTPGPSYLRLRSTALGQDNAGLRVESISLDVSASWK
ncbi:MAG TPA: sialidase family protein [Candidatus Limnocylindria bacterium]|nr:sialidase family protein [Candidatus Limnocylindria bacterium]